MPTLFGTQPVHRHGSKGLGYTAYTARLGGACMARRPPRQDAAVGLGCCGGCMPAPGLLLGRAVPLWLRAGWPGEHQWSGRRWETLQEVRTILLGYAYVVGSGHQRNDRGLLAPTQKLGREPRCDFNAPYTRL